MKRVARFLALAFCMQATVALADLIDINRASKRDLESLPGIGRVTAQKIIEHRPYRRVDELLGIGRFGRSRLDRIRALITVGDLSRLPAPRREIVEEEAPALGPPEGMVAITSWTTGEVFYVEEGTTEGFCPYTGVRWKLSGGGE